MAITKIGINFNASNNVTFPTFNGSKTAADYLVEMPQIANESTNYLFGWGFIVGLFVILLSSLSERFGNHGSGYDDGQAFAISAGITFNMGLLMAMVGYIRNFYPVGVMGGLFLVIGLIIVYINNNK